MKKRTLIIYIPVLMLSLLAIGGIANSYKSWSEKLSGHYPWLENGSLMNDFEQQYNLSKSELSVYDYMYFDASLGGRYIKTSGSIELHTLQAFNDSYPIELIKRIDNEHICVVYNVERNDLQEVFVYVVFEKKTTYFTEEDGVEQAGTYEIWEKNGEFYYLTKELAYDDFADIGIGDSAVKVNDIDCAVSFETRYMKLIPGNKRYFTSYRLLKDGIMEIEFEAPITEVTTDYTSLDDFKITSIVFYPFGDDTMPDKISICEPLF